MKRTKTLAILGIVLVAMCAAIAIVKGVEQHIDSINTIDEEIVTLDTTTISEVSWEYGEASLDFVKTDDVWISTDDETFPVDQDYMYDFLDNFSSVHASFIIDDVEDYDQYGLETPEATLTFTFEDEETEALTISFGAFSTMDSKRYISIGNGSVYLIDDDLLEYVSTDRDDFILNDVMESFDQVTKFDVAGDNNVTICFDDENNYTYTDSYNYYLVENGNYRALSGSYAKAYINLIKNMSFTDYATYNASTSDLSEYGLDNPSLTCTIEGKVTEDDATVVKTVTVYVGVTGEDETRAAYARMGDSEIIYNISTDDYDSLLNGGYDNLRPSEVISANGDYISSVNVTFEGTVYTINIVESDDDIKYTVNDYEVDITDVMSNIQALTLSEVTDEATLGDLEFTFTINQDFNGYDTLTASMYRYDGDSVVVTFNGETIGLMDRSYMVDLRESVTKMILNLGKEETEEE